MKLGNYALTVNVIRNKTRADIKTHIKHNEGVITSLSIIRCDKKVILYDK